MAAPLHQITRACAWLSMVFAGLYLSGCATRVETTVPEFWQIPYEKKDKVVIVRHGDKLGILDSTDFKQEGITGNLRSTVFVDSSERDAVTLERIRAKTYRIPPTLKQLNIYLRKGAPAIDSLFGPEETSPAVRRVSIEKSFINRATVYKKGPVFDGRRAGFVMGAEAGFSYISYAFSDDSANYQDASEPGYNYGLNLGMGITESVVLTTAISVELFNGVNGKGRGDFGRFISPLSIKLFLYENDDAKFTPSSFVVLGTGLSAWYPGEIEGYPGPKGGYAISGVGPIFTVGLGYEYIKHCSVQANVNYSSHTGDANKASGGFVFGDPAHQAFNADSFGFQLVLAALAY